MVLMALTISASFASDAIVPHPQAIANTHKSGEVDRPEMVQYIVKQPRLLSGVVLDETSAVLQGGWQYSTHTPPYVGIGYLHDQKKGKGKKSVTFIPNLKDAGLYEVRMSHCFNIRRSTNTLIEIRHRKGTFRTRINQQDIPEHNKLFRTLGTFRFNKGTNHWLKISNDGTDGKYVIADAVQFLPVNKKQSTK